MRIKQFLIDGVIGNSKLLATYSSKGELLRLWWPHIDYPQHVEEVIEGIYIKGKTDETIWRNSDKFLHVQEYREDSPILLTKSICEELKIEIKSLDFSSTSEKDLLVRSYTIKNNSHEKVKGNFIYYSNMVISENTRYNSSMFDYDEDALLQYRHKYFIATGCNKVISQFTTVNSKEDAMDGVLNGINLSNTCDGAFSIEFEIDSNEELNIDIYTAFGVEKKENAFKVLNKAKTLGVKALKEKTISYWREYFKLGEIDIKDKKVKDIYKKSLMVFKLASDEETGGLIAAPEFDEHRVNCGGYSYCWGRDAAYIATAIEKAGYPSMVEKFYKWSVKAQGEDGAWDQRHFMEGYTGPCWGIQIDEGASLIWGMWKHYEETKNEEFLNYVWKNVKKGAEFIYDFFDEETKMPKESRDLWEERNSQALYSTAAVYSSLIAAYNFALKKGEKELADKYIKRADMIKESVESTMWNYSKNTFYRGKKLHVSREIYDTLKEDERSIKIDSKGYRSYIKKNDDIIDISLIGLCYPFDIYNADDIKMKNTALAIERYCTSPIVGGIKRYEDDKYIGGNPWILTTLWLSIYYAKINDIEKAKKYFDWATDHSTNLNLLPEQIDRQDGSTAWVVPLTWSHSMYVLAALELKKYIEL